MHQTELRTQETHDTATDTVSTLDSTPAAVPDETELEQLLGRLAEEVAGAWDVVAIHLGVRLGLYQALTGGRGRTAAELAADTGCHTRLVEEWLAGQVLNDNVRRDADGRHRLSAAQAAVLATTTSPAYLGGLTEVLVATARGHEQIEAAYRADGSLAWRDQQPAVAAGFDRAFTPLYAAGLLSSWIPALDGVQDRLERGARVADVGCGFGSAIVMLAEAFPASRFVGVDLHDEALITAADRAVSAGVADRVQLRHGAAADLTGGPYDLVTFFDSLHDFGDPAEVVARTRDQLADDGTVLLVEPMTAASADDAGGLMAARIFYPSSALLCTPGALASGGTALGNQVPDATWERIFRDNGFRSFRRVAESPFNRVFEARA